mmetsp:Transcript_51016/g.51415  ORF Transcript_51016/g.51415 Transcript_51016/m.51415 type:complete len:102 (-) Transcript_51016:341-646(-)
MVLEFMSLDANGKIDTKALMVKVPQANNKSGYNIAAANNEVEPYLVSELCNVLDIPESEISVTSNIFDSYGTNSLTVAMFIAGIRGVGFAAELSIKFMRNQ